MISTISADAHASKSEPAVSTDDLARASAALFEVIYDFSADGDLALRAQLRSDLDPPLRSLPLLETAGRLIVAHRSLTPRAKVILDESFGGAIADTKIAAGRIAVRFWSFAADPVWQRDFLPSLELRTSHERGQVSTIAALRSRTGSRRETVVDWSRGDDGVVAGKVRPTADRHLALPSVAAILRAVAFDEGIAAELDELLTSASAAMTRIVSSSDVTDASAELVA